MLHALLNFDISEAGGKREGVGRVGCIAQRRGAVLSRRWAGVFGGQYAVLPRGE